MSNIIYYLKGPSTFSTDLNIQGVKIGSTQNIKSRMKTFQTGFADQVPLVCYYKINKNCYKVDESIKRDFNKIRLKNLGSKGGTEFYDYNKLPEEKLEKYFNDNKIIFTKCNPEDLLNEIANQPLEIDDLINSQIDYYNIKKQEKLSESQINCRFAFKEFIKSNDKSGIIQAPTGWGKSYMMSILGIDYITQTKNDVLIMTKKKEILDSKFIMDVKEMIKSKKLPIKIYDLINEQYDSEIFNNTGKYNKIFIINTDKFISSPKFSDYRNYSYGKIKLVFFDECHWSGADRLSEFLLWIKNNVVDKLIGFSATPVRAKLKNQMNTQKIFSNEDNNYNIIYSCSYLEVIKEGGRVPTNWIMIPTTNSDLIDYQNEDETYKINRVLNKNGFKTFTSWLNNFIDNSVYKKGILWFGSINNLIEFKKFIDENKSKYPNIKEIDFKPTYSKTPKFNEDTSNNIELFKNCESHSILLAVCRATEGFNDKRVDFGFNLYTTESSNPLLDQQKEGRVSRIYLNKKVGYFGFLYNKNIKDYEDNIVRRLGDWIKYIKNFESDNYSCSSNKNNSINHTIDNYIELFLDFNKIKTIDFNTIKNKIFNYCEDFNGSISDIKRIIHKENKKRLEFGKELIDTKEKYDEYAKIKYNWSESETIKQKLKNSDFIDSDLINQNWVKFLRPDFDDWIKQYYKWDQLKDYCHKNKIRTIDEFKNRINTVSKVPTYDYILSGMYNDGKYYKDINTILYTDNEFDLL